MATDRQIAANRANANKSTGPRSQAGRARSSQNARRHGLSIRCDLQDDCDLQQQSHELLGRAAKSDLINTNRDFLAAQIQLKRIAQWRQQCYTEFESSSPASGLVRLRQIASLDRYERYAYTKLYRALSKLEDHDAYTRCHNEPNFLKALQ